MSDTTQPEGDVIVDGVPVVPATDVSDATDTPSEDAVSLADLSRQVESLSSELRGLQGKQDKGETETKIYGERLVELENYHLAREAGATQPQIEREMAIDALIKQGSVEQTPGGTGGSASSDTVKELFQAAGLDSSKDPQVAELYREGADVTEFAKLVVTRVKEQSKPSSDAQLPPSAPNSPPMETDDEKEMGEAYSKELDGAMRLGKEQVLQVRRKYRNLGMAV